MLEEKLNRRMYTNWSIGWLISLAAKLTPARETLDTEMGGDIEYTDRTIYRDSERIFKRTNGDDTEASRYNVEQGGWGHS